MKSLRKEGRWDPENYRETKCRWEEGEVLVWVRETRE